MGSTRPLRVLLSNDDGPPSEKESPFVVDFVRELEKTLGWKVTIILPSSQKSWISKAFQIREEVGTTFVYFKRDGSLTSPVHHSRPLKEEEEREIILLDGTPAACVNIGIHHFCQEQGVDLIITGPNLGRNTSSAFALSSGTIGGAMEGALCGVPAIALSYGVIERPIPPQIVRNAHKIATRVVSVLWNTWNTPGGARENNVAVYNVNVPLDFELKEDSPVEWRRMNRNQYGRLFKIKSSEDATEPGTKTSRTAGPGAISDTQANAAAHPLPEASHLEVERVEKRKKLTFIFAPDIAPLIKPDATHSIETDAHAMQSCTVSVTALKACFDELNLETSRKIANLRSQL